MEGGVLKTVLYAAGIAAMLMLTVALGTGTWLGYRWFTDTHLPTVDADGDIRARVVRATLFARSDLRVGRLSGVVQGVGRASRFWGWLNSSQVVLAPFTVDYYVPLARLRPADIAMDRSGRHFIVHAPDVYTDQPNIDLARTSLNRVGGVFVTRGAYAEMAGRTAASAQQSATEKAQSAANMAANREFARQALKRLFAGALAAAQVDATVDVVFAGDPVPSNEHWDVSRSIDDVLHNRY